MKRSVFGVIGIVLLSFIVVLLLLFLNQSGAISLESKTVNCFKEIQKYFTVVVILGALTSWVIVFFNGGFTKYRLHDIAGIIGSTLFMFSFASILLNFNLMYLFLMGGVLCLYCVLVPPISALYSKFSNKTWEPTIVWSIILSISLYALSVIANNIINELFGVDPSYFTGTLPVAMLLVLTPFTSVISFIFVLHSTFLLTRTNNNKEQKEDLNFYQVNTFFASYAVLVFSLVYGASIDSVLEKTAATADFNSNHPCSLDEGVQGVIFLDPTLKSVLIYDPSADQKYLIKQCFDTQTTDNNASG